VTAAVGTVPVRTQAIVFIDAGFVIVGMAACAVRLIGRSGPDDRRGITRVAGGATQVTGMVARVGSRHMPERRWQPCVRDMADIAVLRGHKMIRLFIIRMTTGACAGDIHMVKACG